MVSLCGLDWLLKTSVDDLSNTKHFLVNTPCMDIHKMYEIKLQDIFYIVCLGSCLIEQLLKTIAEQLFA